MGLTSSFCTKFEFVSFYFLLKEKKNTSFVIQKPVISLVATCKMEMDCSTCSMQSQQSQFGLLILIGWTRINRL